jgi:hypothetical protein
MTGRQSLEREEYWQGVMRQQESSGLSISAFCRKQKVAEGSFFYWRRRLIKRQPRKGAVAKKPPRQSRPRKNTTATFVPVDIPTPSSTSGARCEVILPDGCRIIMPMQCDAGRLRDILGVLGEWSC